MRLSQTLGELKYILQDDQRIRISVGKELGLPLLPGQKRLYLGCGLLEAL